MLICAKTLRQCELTTVFYFAIPTRHVCFIISFSRNAFLGKGFYTFFILVKKNVLLHLKHVRFKLKNIQLNLKHFQLLFQLH